MYTSVMCLLQPIVCLETEEESVLWVGYNVVGSKEGVGS